MDSMKSLNTSLPSSSNGRQDAPEKILQAFRTAALSVTNLYKAAASDQAAFRQAGYQDALEDLLKFLDRENLGVTDGEGWRIRQWATQRYDGRAYQQIDDEEEHSDSECTVRASNTAQDQEDTNSQTQEQENGVCEPVRPSSNPPIFTFTANQASGHDPQTEDRPRSPDPIQEHQTSDAESTVRILSRNRQTARSYDARHGTRTNPREFAFNASTKRKIHFPDFFDISNVYDRKDGPNGGSGSKRSRFV